jgi:putative salt-induced outer membrane protein YdiY
MRISASRTWIVAALAVACAVTSLAATAKAQNSPRYADGYELPYATSVVGRLPPVNSTGVAPFDAPSVIEAAPISAGPGPDAAAIAPETIPPDMNKAATNKAETVEAELADAEKIEVTPLSSWHQPKYWFGPTWTGSIELGMNGSEGNAQTFSMRAGANLKRETKLYTLAFELSHARTTADSLETQNNALGKIRLDRNLGESRWTLFGTGSGEYDQFKAFDLRLSAHAGLGYKFIKNESTTLVGRIGSGVSHEIGGPDDSYVPEALLGLDFEHQITAKQKLVFKSEYLPEWGDYENYRLVSDASWECLLDEASNLSLKIGAIDRYDSTPNGLKANDIDYLLLLLWKL